MEILYVWPLWFLLLLPVVIFLYFLKQKTKDQSFSSLYLWREMYQNIRVRNPFEKWKRNILLLLQILILLLLIIALTSPYLKRGSHAYDHVVLVIDNSGSMNGIYQENKSRLSVAKEKAKDYVDGLSGKASVTLMIGEQNGKILLANAWDHRAIKNAIEKISVSDVDGDLNGTVSWISSLAKQWNSYQAVFFTDSEVALGQLNGTIVDLSSDGENGAISYVSHTKNKDGTLSVLVRVENKGTKPLATDVNLYCDDKMEAIQNVSIDTGKSKTLYFENIPYRQKKETVIKAELNEKDSLERDNICYDIVREEGEKKVLLVTEQNTFLESAMNIDERVSLYKTKDLSNVEEGYDVYVFDGMIPKKLPQEGSIIYVNPPTGTINDLFTVGGSEKNAIITTAKGEENKYFSKVSFGVNTYKSIEKPSWGKAFFQSGKNVVGFWGSYKGRQVSVLGFDLHDSELPLQKEFPILIYQMLEQSIEPQLLSEAVITAGDSIIVESKTITKTKVGLYQLTAKNIKNQEDTETLAVNFPVEQESAMKKIVINQEKKQDIEKYYDVNKITAKNQVKKYLLFLVIVFLVLEFWVYLRKES